MPNRLHCVQCRSTTPVGIVASYALLASPVVFAGTGFGIHDARTLAMGGTSVASADNSNAQFYNAALLAFNEEIEERTRDARFLFPVVVPQLSESAISLEELARYETADALTDAVDAFNATPGAPAARGVVDAAADLDAALSRLDDTDLLADVYIGLAVSEPSKFEGGGFFLGTRLLAGGQAVVDPADRALLDAYREGLTFIATNGAEGAPHPELFDANGMLADPGGDFESTASAAGIALTEAGVAMSRQVRLFGQPVAAGITFKVQRTETFQDDERLVDERIDTGLNNVHDGNVNFDIGLVREFGDSVRLGVAVKDVIRQDYETGLGTTLRMRPRARVGVAWQAGPVQIAADADVTRNEPLAAEEPTQEAAIGVEWALDAPVRIRAGYRRDMRGNREGIASVGAGVTWRRLVVDLAWAEGHDARAAALQFGIAF